MTAPRRIQLRRTKGFRLREVAPGAVKVDRGGRWGNPFDLRSPDHCWTAIAVGCKADKAGRQQASVILFRRWILQGQAACTEAGLYAEGEPITASPRIEVSAPPTLTEIRQALGGRDLACWCRPGEPCHADVLLELANAPAALLRGGFVMACDTDQCGPDRSARARITPDRSAKP